MATAEGLSKVVSYKKEETFGVIPPKTGSKTIRRVTSSFNLAKETYNSEEIRQDYQQDDVRHGVRSVEGSVSGELSAGSYSDFIASALARDWTATTATELGSTEITVLGGIYTITRTTGSWITDGVRVGNVIRLTGFNTTNNDKNLLIVSATETALNVVVLNASELTVETVASGGTYVVQGKTTFAPSTGHTSDSYTFEEYQKDIKTTSITAGNKVNTLGIALPATGLTTIDLAFMGQDLKQTGATQYFDSSLPQSSTGIFAAVNGALIVDGKVVALVTSLNVNINRNLSGEAVVGSNVKPQIYDGRIIVEGDFSTLYQDDTFADYFRDETEISLVFALTENNAPDSGFMAFTLPRIKLNTDTKDDGEKGIVSQNSFTALKGRGTDGFEATTMMVQDSSLV